MRTPLHVIHASANLEAIAAVAPFQTAMNAQDAQP